jgi:tricarboxylate carrier
MPPFSLESTQFDQTIFAGRVRHFFTVTNPVYLFATSAQISEAKGKLQTFREGKRGAATDAELWKARTLMDAVLHPDTGEPVPAMFRVCAFAPANIPICAGMLMTAPTMGNVLFWQWVNQTYNAGFNYCNRNASGSLTNEKLAGIYAGATTLSCGLAIGLGEVVKRAPLNAATAALVGKFVPYCAVASSNVFNFVSMRSSELFTGIPIKDKEGKELGLSQEAAKAALFQGAVTRAVIPAPVLILPPIMMRAVDKFVHAPRLRPAIELSIIVSCVAAALPCAIALFPQEAALPVSRVEKQFQGLKTSKNESVDQVFFNKGV